MEGVGVEILEAGGFARCGVVVVVSVAMIASRIASEVDCPIICCNETR